MLKIDEKSQTQAISIHEQQNQCKCNPHAETDLSRLNSNPDEQKQEGIGATEVARSD